MDTEIFDSYKFATVTFEHDIYYTNFGNTREESRKIFTNRGYICVFTDINNGIEYPYEDWYVHPDLVDMDYVNNLIKLNEKKYTPHRITRKTIWWKDLQYP